MYLSDGVPHFYNSLTQKYWFDVRTLKYNGMAHRNVTSAQKVEEFTNSINEIKTIPTCR